MEEDHAELQYGIGDTVNILQVLKSAVKKIKTEKNNNYEK
jgi:hypothetical protein